MTTANGVPRDKLEDLLTANLLSEGYRPTLPYWALAGADGHLPAQIYLVRDIELMRIHPMVRLAMECYRSGIAGAEFEPSNCSSPEIEEFVVEQCKRFWDRGVPTFQHGYEYGWIGGEFMYLNDNGLLKWRGVRDFSPWDTYLLTQMNKPVGIRVKNITDKDHVDLFLASSEVPAKGMWYAHEPRYGALYGQSQYLGAWRAWRRLAWKDAAETVVDGGMYRFAYQGPLVRYPSEDLSTTQNVPATQGDSQGIPRRPARDVARQIGEIYKAGATVGLPSEKWPSEMGGDYKWDLDINQATIDLSPLIEYVKYLKSEIAYGMTVPLEMMEAAETGSGYSGRKIPLEAFLSGQQRVGDRILAIFIEQVLGPLVRWNWGPYAKFDVKLKSFLLVKTQQQVGIVAEHNKAAAETAQHKATPGWPREDVEAQKAQHMQAQQAKQAAFSIDPEVLAIANAISRAE